MVKSVRNVTLDTDLVVEVVQRRINLSATLNSLLRQYLYLEETTEPLGDINELDKLLASKIGEVEAIKGKISVELKKREELAKKREQFKRDVATGKIRVINLPDK